MRENDLQVFIDGTTVYFNVSTKHPASVGTPYLLEPNKTICYDFTGIIGISGKRKGCVYFTAPGVMLTQLLVNMGELERSKDILCDIVGEVANTISGNARKEFGREFMISVPLVIAGEPEKIQLPKDIRSYVIPISWQSFNAALVLCLE